MKLIWLGHSGFRIEIGNQILLLDPWMTGNPMFPEDARAKAIKGATHILVTHGHFDHAPEASAIAAELGIPLVGIPELVNLLALGTDIQTIGFNKGGTVQLGDVAVTMVNAIHSSSIKSPSGDVYAGVEAGFMISGEGHTIYATGDTDVMADMGVMNDLHAPDIGILCAGGYYTMDMKRAAYAAKKFFNFKVVIPCHYRTFPLLEQSADELKAGLPDVDVIEPKVMVAIDI
ncbi:metal-dependent hydrolase [Profundibacter sp.]